MTAVVFEEDPQHPFFDGIEDPKLQVLFAIALGCDALPHVSGQKNFGAAGLHKLLDSTTNNVNDQIVLVTSDEYAATQNAVDGLNMFLRQNKEPKPKPRSKSHTLVTPTGFQLLHYRANLDKVEEFTDRLDSVSACCDKWKMALEGAKVQSLRCLQFPNNTDDAGTQSENGADGLADDEDGSISMTMEGNDDVDQPTAVLSTVTTSRRDEQLSILRTVMKKWQRRRNTGQSKQEFAEDNGVTWGVFNKYTASNPNKRR
jgi:hypothetical protein